MLASIGCYLLTLWPFFAITDAYRMRALLTACALGFIPSTLYGAFLTRKFGLPGATGFFAGALATAIFLILRMQQLFLASQVQIELTPEFPSFTPYVVAGAWVVWSALIGIVLLPKGELPGKDE